MVSGISSLSIKGNVTAAIEEAVLEPRETSGKEQTRLESFINTLILYISADDFFFLFFIAFLGYCRKL